MLTRKKLSSLCLLLCVLAVSAQAAQETVSYPDLTGFDSVTYRSEFFGYQSGINRDFTNYGRDFAEPVTQPLDWSNAQVALADFNADSLDDVVGYAPDSGTVTWLAGSGDGTFDAGKPNTFKARAQGIFVAGDFNGDGRMDIGVIAGDGQSKVYIRSGNGQGEFGPEKTDQLKVSDGQVAAGDFNGDGLADLCVYDTEGSGDLQVFFRKKAGGFGSPVQSAWPAEKPGGQLVAADFNGDLYWDVALYGSSTCPDGFAFRFGRGNGKFGPTQQEEEVGDQRDLHLHANFPWSMSGARPVAGQINDDGTGDIGLYVPSTAQLLTRMGSGHEAYDYSVHLIKDGSRYRMWHGGRWRRLDKNGNPIPSADGDHVLSAHSLDGRRWYRRIDSAEFLKGDEQGFKDWWTNNYLEPEVVKVKGTYYMFWQVEIDPKQKLDTGEEAVTQADRIGLSASADGINWKRKTDRGVVINIPNPETTSLDHEEVIYVPDDPDGKPWWLYTFHFVLRQPGGHVRIRSNDPTTFDWNQREPVAGLSQIGNQVGYADEAPGGRMFFRITFTWSKDGRTVPTFQLSRDGLNWTTARADGLVRPQLASSRNDKNNKNVYFLGMSTIDGTGKMEHLGDGKFHVLYGATTANSPGHPGIWFSEIGVGEVFIMFNVGRT